jgi:hypothetical protein
MSLVSFANYRDRVARHRNIKIERHTVLADVRFTPKSDRKSGHGMFTDTIAQSMGLWVRPDRPYFGDAKISTIKLRMSCLRG